MTVGRKLLALDAASGRPAMGFGVAGEIDLPAPYEGAPTVFEDRVIVGSTATVPDTGSHRSTRATACARARR